MHRSWMSVLFGTQPHGGKTDPAGRFGLLTRQQAPNLCRETRLVRCGRSVGPLAIADSLRECNSQLQCSKERPVRFERRWPAHSRVPQIAGGNVGSRTSTGPTIQDLVGIGLLAKRRRKDRSDACSFIDSPTVRAASLEADIHPASSPVR
jgi:hypothetical protein